MDGFYRLIGINSFNLSASANGQFLDANAEGKISIGSNVKNQIGFDLGGGAGA